MQYLLRRTALLLVAISIRPHTSVKPSVDLNFRKIIQRSATKTYDQTSIVFSEVSLRT